MGRCLCFCLKLVLLLFVQKIFQCLYGQLILFLCPHVLWCPPRVHTWSNPFFYLPPASSKYNNLTDLITFFKTSNIFSAGLMIDYCNLLYFGITPSCLSHVQLLQNAAESKKRTQVISNKSLYRYLRVINLQYDNGQMTKNKGWGGQHSTNVLTGGEPETLRSWHCFWRKECIQHVC